LAVSRKMQVSIDEQVFRVSGLLESRTPDMAAGEPRQDGPCKGVGWSNLRR